MLDEREIICLCPHCKAQINMRFNVKYLAIEVKELKTWKKPKPSQKTGRKGQ